VKTSCFFELHPPDKALINILPIFVRDKRKILLTGNFFHVIFLTLNKNRTIPVIYATLGHFARPAKSGIYQQILPTLKQE
jgi:hypothetical protein